MLRFSRRRFFFLLLVVAAVAATLAAGTAASADPAPGSGVDYDLSQLRLTRAVFNETTGTIVTTGSKSKTLLPAMEPAPPSGRYLELDVEPQAGGANLFVTWWEAGAQFHATDVVHLASGGGRQVVLFDMAGMGASVGTVKVRIDGSASGGSTIHRVTLYEEDLGPPNIVFILVDDLAADELDLGFYRNLPETSVIETELIDKGTTFKNLFNATPLCCPSRASFLTGQYPHNHRVYGNNGKSVEGDNGGILRFFLDGRDETSIGTWMQAAGYQTVLVGKYLNGYPNRQGLKGFGITEEYVPAGWDEWYGSFLHDRTKWAPINFGYEQFRFNENGTVVIHGPGAYLTDVEADYAVDFIDRNAGDEPFFMFLAPFAPHGPTIPRSDHLGRHEAAGVAPATPPSCNEPDLSDKPAHIRAVDGLFNYGNCWGPGWQAKLDMTLALDELIADVIAELEQEGILDNTYIFFTSDNGLLRGVHQIGGKSAPYEESIRVPLIVRGPGVAEGTVKPHLVLNADIAPTLLDLADGGPTPGSPPIDGESIMPILNGLVSSQDWRDAVLIELLTPNESHKQLHTIPRYFALRTLTHMYAEYETGDSELYDLVADPFQLDSINSERPPDLMADLTTLLTALDDCAGTSCAEAARIPEPPGTSHVEDVRIQLREPSNRAIVKVHVYDQDDRIVDGAVVTGTWQVGAGPPDGPFVAVSNMLGKAKFIFDLIDPTSGLTLEFCVTDITHADLIYDPGANSKTCQSATWS